MKKKSILVLSSVLALVSCSQNNTSSNNENTSSTVSENEVSETIDYSNRRVVIIGVDGAGHQFNDELTPKTLGIFKDYATSKKVLTSNPTISAQSWGSIMTGVMPSFHGFTNDSIKVNANSIYEKYPTIFKLVRDTYNDATLASFCNWNAINVGIVEDKIGVYKATHSDDDVLTASINTYLKENDPKLLFVQFDSVDHAGHGYGYASNTYYDALKAIDGNIEAIYNQLVELNRIDDTLFIVTSDHGGLNNSHGGLSDVEKYVFCGIRNKDINKTEIKNMKVRDIPSIVSYYLNAKKGENWDSYIPLNLFKSNMTPPQKSDYLIDEDLIIKTPALQAANGLYNYFNKNDIELYHTFDKNVNDIASNNSATMVNIPIYKEGILGEALNLNTENYLKMPYLKFNDNESFTLSAYLMVNHKIIDGNDPVIFTNKDWALGTNKGLTVAYRRDDIKISVGSGNNTKNEAFNTISDYEKKWYHLIISYDKDSKTLSTYLDFNLKTKIAITGSNSFVGDFDFTIGNNYDGLYNQTCDFLIDDFIKFKRSFDENDVNKMKEYYKNAS
ncbi:MAG: alkaline phosphatase family protein [Candidatus Caccosoma sp.]|nr:alkaline phosphatase family protein [Candidatus Caccosoma sp.]